MVNSKCSSISAERLHRVCFVHDNYTFNLTCECELVTDSSSLVYCITCMCKTSAVFKKKISVVSRISAVFFTYRDNSAKPNISRIFVPAIRNFYKIRLVGLSRAQAQRQTEQNTIHYNEVLTDKHRTLTLTVSCFSFHLCRNELIQQETVNDGDDLLQRFVKERDGRKDRQTDEQRVCALVTKRSAYIQDAETRRL